MLRIFFIIQQMLSYTETCSQKEPTSLQGRCSYNESNWVGRFQVPIPVLDSSTNPPFVPFFPANLKDASLIPGEEVKIFFPSCHSCNKCFSRNNFNCALATSQILNILSTLLTRLLQHCKSNRLWPSHKILTKGHCVFNCLHLDGNLSFL